VLALRTAHGLNQPQLAERMQDLGQPMHATAVSKIEQRDRRVDVDDLVALAAALNASPNRLLLPAVADNSPADLTSALTVESIRAWRWARGYEPLLPPDRTSREARRAFLLKNQPDEADYLTLSDSEIIKHREIIGRLVEVIGDARKQGMTPGAVRRLVDIAFKDHGTGTGETDF